MWGREGDPYPTHTHELHIKFCVIDVLPVFVNLLLFTLFDAHAHKTNNTTTPVTQCT